MKRKDFLTAAVWTLMMVAAGDSVYPCLPRLQMRRREDKKDFLTAAVWTLMMVAAGDSVCLCLTLLLPTSNRLSILLWSRLGRRGREKHNINSVQSSAYL